jgi:NAD(P)-dependent dehydrogenase (short-subunit alcohol dehydrogenase family)
MWSTFMNKTALVTGASAGIGEATVRRFLADGFIVYAAARRLDRMAPLAAAGAKLLPLDLTDDSSIVAAIDKIRSETGRLDVLINNAGYGSYGAVEDVPMDEARRQFEVNVFGAARLCQLALPMMRAQKSGKIVNVTSIGGKFGMPFGAWYHATKFALEGLSDSLRLETKPFGIDVIVIEPGAIRTEWSGIARESLLARSGATAYGPNAQRMAKLFDSDAAARRASPPEAVAKIIGDAVAAKQPQIRYAAAGGAPMFLFLARVLPDRAKDAIIQRMTQSRPAA